jgi:cytosine/adenosine deaminase-related metal-dependent hydrolase
MTTTLIVPGVVMTMDSDDRLLRGGAILVEGQTITRVLSAGELSVRRPVVDVVVDAGELVALPGFIQTHVHLCQTLFRGLAEDLGLLDWLQSRIFPFEAALTSSSMYASARLGIAELIRGGTTTIMDMGSIHHEEEVVRAITETGLRAFVGKAMMDINTMHPPLKEPTDEALRSTLRQAKQWHGSAGGRIRYAVAPRFILSCTDALLREAHAMTADFAGMLFHMHASENRHELEAVRARCGMDNVAYFDHLGILQNNTCLAHCVWLNDDEIAAMRERDACVLHCPSSNLKLGSGIADIPRYLHEGIRVSLGADGAPCNNRLDMFAEMHLAALIQKPGYGPTAMPARTVLKMATAGGAAALGIERETGSIVAGKRADIILLDLRRPWSAPVTGTPDALVATVVHACSPDNVDSVMIDGQWVYRRREYTMLDVDRAKYDADTELRALLQRTSIS